MNPYQVTRDFEKALCEYTGAPFAVAVNSCTAAILLALKWFCPFSEMQRITDEARPIYCWQHVEVPRRTYVSVPCSVIRAGHFIRWTDDYWRGEYRFDPLPVWDSARRFTSGMYRKGQYQCVSFATNKIMGIEQGGAILHDDPDADAWFRKMRFDGRTEGVSPHEDTFELIGHHCIMLPSVAAALILKLFHLPRINEDMPDYDYPDLSKHQAFKGYAK